MADERTLTTVVIPNYNGIEYLKNCLDSLLKGTNVPEIIVVDNGSLDGSRELVTAEYPKVRLITFAENRGFDAAVNAGIKAADTEYVFLLNNDTVVAENCVEELEKAMENADRCFSVGAKMINMKFPGKIDDAGDSAGPVPEGRIRMFPDIRNPAEFLQPAQERLFIGESFLKPLVILMRSILLISRILISDIVPIFWDTGVNMHRRLLSIMQAAALADQGIIPLRWT